MKAWLDHLSQVESAKKNHVVVTLVNINGSAPQIVGAKMLVGAEGLIYGTVGGGKIEAHGIKLAKEFLQSKALPCLLSFNLQKDIGMTCGGEVSLFFDPQFFTQWTVAVFGAGHVSQELCRVLQTWPCQLKVFDTRQEWIDKLPDSFNLEKKISQNLASEVATLPKNTCLLSLTQGHSFDVPVLEVALKNSKNFHFIGVIGSAVKGQKIKSELKNLGVAEVDLSRLHCPIGLDFGDNTPPEIAISIAAQLLTLKPNSTEQKESNS